MSRLATFGHKRSTARVCFEDGQALARAKTSAALAATYARKGASEKLLAASLPPSAGDTNGAYTCPGERVSPLVTKRPAKSVRNHEWKNSASPLTLALYASYEGLTPRICPDQLSSNETLPRRSTRKKFPKIDVCSTSNWSPTRGVHGARIVVPSNSLGCSRTSERTMLGRSGRGDPELYDDCFWRLRSAPGMSQMGRALLLGRRSRRAGMLHIAAGRGRTATSISLVTGAEDAVRPGAVGHEGLLPGGLEKKNPTMRRQVARAAELVVVDHP